MKLPARGVLIWMFVLTNLMVLAGLFLYNQKAAKGYFSLQKPLPVYGTLGGFRLIEKDGRPFTRDLLNGSVWVANFMFTRCQGQCPAMSLKMSSLQGLLPARIRLVSFSVDPQTDTPAVLSEYAKTYHAKQGKWFFVTGGSDEIKRLLSDFHLSNSEDPALHSLRFVLLDARGNVRGYYDSSEAQSIENLVADSKMLLKEKIV